MLRRCACSYWAQNTRRLEFSALPRVVRFSSLAGRRSPAASPRSTGRFSLPRPSGTSRTLPIARCPNVTEDHRSTWLECAYCPKVFTTERSHQRHTALHKTHRHECVECFARFTTRSSMRSHVAMHSLRPYFRCDVCGEQWLHEISLKRHLESEGPEHVSKKKQAELWSTRDVNEAFQCPRPVVGNVLYHTTNLRRASNIFNTRKFAAHRLSDRPHDGALTLADAPPAAFFSLAAGDELIPRTSFLPRYAEPGELTASLLLDLNALVAQKPSSENSFRLFLVSCVPDSKRSARAPMRVTVLFVRRRDAWWCVQQGLPELDMRDNRLLVFNESERTWSCATRFYTRDLGWRQVRLVATVAYGLEFEEESVQWLDVSHVYTENAETFCPDCGTGFINAEDLFHHLQGNPSFQCAFSYDGGCSRVYPSALARDVHERTHIDDLPYTCTADDKCTRSFKSVSALRSHERHAHSEERPYFCTVDDECHKSFKSSSSLAAHEKTHSTEREFVCTLPECDKAFKTKSALDQHVLRHDEKPTMVCQVSWCQKAFRTKHDLWAHQRSHEPRRKRKLVHCPVNGCDYSATNPEQLVAHDRGVHRGEYLACDQCSFTTAFDARLRLHTSQVHYGSFQYRRDDVTASQEPLGALQSMRS